MARALGEGRWRTSPLVMRRWLGSELVRLRSAAGLTQRDVAAALGCSVGKVSYLESAERAVNLEDLEGVILELYDVPEEERGPYLDAARIACQRGWWDEWNDEDLPWSERRYLGMEDGATLLRAYLPSIVHGLLQTSEYTRGVLRAYKTIPEVRIDRIVKLRQVRQSLLTRADDPLNLHLILDEAAVTRQVCSAEAMKEQLLHIANVGGAMSNVVLQILPFATASPGAYFGPFSVLEFPWVDDSGLVFTEGLVEGRYFDTRAEVYEYASLFERLSELALTPDESLAMLRSRSVVGL
jgi:transcriptional regulator with XRE-family HTH domain